MKVILYGEYINKKLYELDNTTYISIKYKFTKALGELVAKKMMHKMYMKTLQEISYNSYVDITDCYKIIGI